MLTSQCGCSYRLTFTTCIVQIPFASPPTFGTTWTLFPICYPLIEVPLPSSLAAAPSAQDVQPVPCQLGCASTPPSLSCPSQAARVLRGQRRPWLGGPRERCASPAHTPCGTTGHRHSDRAWAPTEHPSLPGAAALPMSPYPLFLFPDH